jgi:hypothetical protein
MPTTASCRRLRCTTEHLWTPVSTTAAAAAAAGPKIYLSVDIEGIGNVVNEAHLGPAGFEYEQARRWMTNEAVVAAETRARPLYSQ